MNRVIKWFSVDVWFVWFALNTFISIIKPANNVDVDEWIGLDGTDDADPSVPLN